MTGQKRIVKPFHRTIFNALEQLLTGTLPAGKRNLMIMMPPRHGKTEIIKDFISYSLGIFPDSQYIYTSYSSTLATQQTRKIRDCLIDPTYRFVFKDVNVVKSSESDISTDKGGAVYATGVEGSVTGFGAGLKRKEWGGCIIIDDPLKANEAHSQAALDSIKEWYTGTLFSRKNSDDTPIILIQQRLGVDDLPGHIMSTEPELWHILEIPALNENNEALWEETKSAASLLKLKEVDEFTFWSQYQQKPQIQGGNIIKREWWKRYITETYDVNSYCYITIDTAMKVTDKSDRTSMGAWHATGDYCDCLEESTGKWEFPELCRRVEAFYKKWKKFGCKAIFVEDRATGTPLVQFLQERGLPVVAWLPSVYEFPDDKLGRVKLSIWYIEAGRVRLPDDNPEWIEPFIDQCAAFTDGKSGKDDSVDMMTMAVSIWKYKGGGYDIEAG